MGLKHDVQLNITYKISFYVTGNTLFMEEKKLVNSVREITAICSENGSKPTHTHCWKHAELCSVITCGVCS